MSEIATRMAGPSALSDKAESILAAAWQSFLARGFGAVSMDAIAREAGASKATVYAYFASKEELFGAVIAREGERYFRGFSAGELDPCAVEASLAEIARRFLDLVLSPEAIAINRIIISEASRFPQLGEVFWRAGPERTRVQIEAFLSRGGRGRHARHRRHQSRRRAVRRTAARRHPPTPAAAPRRRRRRGGARRRHCGGGDDVPEGVRGLRGDQLR